MVLFLELKIAVSAPDPPTKRSFPRPPLSLSFPDSPLIILSSLLPVIVLAPVLPVPLKTELDNFRSVIELGSV